MGRYGAETRNKEGSMIVNFAKRMDLAIVNNYFKKDEHRVTYKSGKKSTKVDYGMCRRRNLKKMCNCKVIVNECVAKQHRMLVCKMALIMKKSGVKKIRCRKKVKSGKKSKAKNKMVEIEGVKLSRSI